MTAKEYRKIARSKLRGKWGTLAVITLIYSILLSIISTITLGIGLFIFYGAFTLGYTICVMLVVKNQKPPVEIIFSGFHDFWRSLALFLLRSIFTFLWSLLFIIPGIIKHYADSMSFFILKDNPHMTAKQALDKSAELMKGNKWKLFCLELSFIGWGLLSIPTFGIIMLWVQPYMQTAYAVFYQNLITPKQQDLI